MSDLVEFLQSRDDAPHGFASRVLNLCEEKEITTVEGLRQLRRRGPFNRNHKIGVATANHLDLLLGEEFSPEDLEGPPTWESVAEGTLRLAVPGGWIYRVRDSDQRSALVFVPRPKQ